MERNLRTKVWKCSLDKDAERISRRVDYRYQVTYLKAQCHAAEKCNSKSIWLMPAESHDTTMTQTEAKLDHR